MLNATTTAGAQLRNLVIIVICIALLAGINVVFNDYIVRVISTIFIFMILAVSYNLINGVTGQLSLEPNGFVAVGAYVTALLILSSDSKVDMFEMAAPSPWILSLHAGFLPALLISGLCAAALAVCLAVPVFRVRGDYLAIVTLGFGFIIKILAINNPQITNGAIGLNDIPQQPHLLFWCGLFALLATGMILQLVWSKYGRMMKAIRDDEDAAIAMGVNTFRIKTCAFATSAFFEGIGGGLLASLLTTISPGLFDFMLTFQLLIIIVLGGLGSTTGALLGTVLVVGSGEWLRFLDQPLQFFGHDLGAYPGLRMVVFSLLLLIIMLFAREGLLGKKRFGRPEEGAAAMAENKVILQVQDVTMQFGGLRAIDNVSFHVDKAEIFGLIGPNGAGKTTLFNVITANYKPTSGSVTLAGTSLKGLKPNQVVNAGIARTFQNIRLFNSMTVLENVMVGLDRASRYSLLEAALHIGRYFPAERAAKAKAMAILEDIGIATSPICRPQT
ncbi:branched-chain amino acid transport system permease LivM [Klebsiella pneumoniae]|uniref:Branched-chain amino acid transport system permease LivM n=4 Tax=Enterobacteriaceae TaxID=543 RepID=A0A377WD82_KLEPN|nr:branched-chain amino acid transport system permease LivM [Klebsiella pneumoniae]